MSSHCWSVRTAGTKGTSGVDVRSSCREIPSGAGATLEMRTDEMFERTPSGTMVNNQETARAHMGTFMYIHMVATCGI